jgi:hypothetical protein
VTTLDNTQTLSLAALNSATKYPSIETHHQLGERGSLTEDLGPFVGYTGDVILTEKVDGTNGRIILLPGGDYFIGSREELLHARGDRVENPALGIVAALKPLADRIVTSRGNGADPDATDRIHVVYLEVYGGKVGSQAKQYSSLNASAYRLFDYNTVDPEVLTWPRELIASWRDSGGQTFIPEAALHAVADGWDVPLAPRLARLSFEDMPTDIQGMRDFLSVNLPRTLVALDDNAGGRAEGIVLRSEGRSVISKARFEDYERTLKRRASPPRDH